MIKAIIFDLGGVLFTSGTKRFVDYLHTTYDLDKEKVKNLLDGELGTLYREAKITRDQFWQRFLKAVWIDEDVDTLEDRWISGYELIEGTKQVVQELSKKYKVFFLSDNVSERIKRINKKYNFLEWFEGGIFSHEVGVRKPNPKIYKLILKKIGVKPNQAIFIDDKPHFLPSAAQLGIKTILFENPDKLQKELKKILRN